MKNLRALAGWFGARLEAVTPALGGLITLILLLILVHGLTPRGFTIDGVTVSLIVILLVVILVPILDSATLPGGGGFKLRRKLDELQQGAAKGLRNQSEIAPAAPQVVTSEDDQLSRLDRQASLVDSDRISAESNEIRSSDDIADEVLRESARSPRVGLMLISAELDRAVRDVLRTTNWVTPDSTRSLRAGAARLVELGVLSRDLATAVESFTEIRNAIVHGSRAVSDQATLRAIDAGLTILRGVLSIPRQRSVVAATGIPLFGIPDGITEISDVWGLTLELIAHGEVRGRFHTYPTTRASYYQVGKEVTWEWNMQHVWGETWARIDGVLTLVWSSSAEFAGRHLDEF